MKSSDCPPASYVYLETRIYPEIWFDVIIIIKETCFTLSFRMIDFIFVFFHFLLYLSSFWNNANERRIWSCIVSSFSCNGLYLQIHLNNRKWTGQSMRCSTVERCSTSRWTSNTFKAIYVRQPCFVDLNRKLGSLREGRKMVDVPSINQNLINVR